MRKLGLTAALAIALAIPASARAFSLRNLAGIYSGTTNGFVTLCEGPCSQSDVTFFPVGLSGTEVLTFDNQGNFCGTSVTAASPTDGTTSPAQVSSVIVTGNITSFDTTTGQGQANFGAFTGNSCVGTSFSTPGATFVATGTFHLVVSSTNGEIDTISTSYTSAANNVGSFIEQATLKHQ